VEMTEQILMRTADPRTSSQGCGGDSASDVPNNGFGWGVVNARSAIESLSQQGSLTGVITDALTGAVVADATVSLHPLGDLATTVMTATTSAAGVYSFITSWGEYAITASKTGYHDGQASPIYVVGGKITKQNTELDPTPDALSDLNITISGANILLTWTHQDDIVDHYEVWRVLDKPYFDPAASGVKLGEASAGTVGDALSFTDTTSPLGNTDSQGSYLVLGVSVRGVRAKPEPRKGEFDFALTPGAS